MDIVSHKTDNQYMAVRMCTCRWGGGGWGGEGLTTGAPTTLWMYNTTYNTGEHYIVNLNT